MALFTRHKSFDWPSTIIHRRDVSEWGDRIAVFAHFHPSTISPEVVAYTKALNEAGWSVLFISTGDTLTPDQFDPVLPYCSTVIQRNNIGYDFGSYALGTQLTDNLDISDLLWCNDSVVGPFHALAPIEDQMQDVDVWAMTDSHERKHHLQSYYVHLSGTVARSDAFQRFVRSIRPQKSKRKLIKRYEIGLSEAMRNAGFTIQSFIDSASIIESNGKNKERHSNITIHLPLAILEAGMPYVKREVLQHNPGNIDLDELKEAIERYSNE